ncbi:MAG: outer membrane protein transport protein [Cryomorphaceae bacterium]|nr:outer membrane protein transport protein [Cryomorphaceae bacterium]
MKHNPYLVLIALSIGLASAHAQSTMSAVWMQRNQLFGTARYNGSAGALAALGGDGTSSLENPALMNSSSFGGMELSGYFRSDRADLNSQGAGIGQAYIVGSWRHNSKARFSLGLAHQQQGWFPNYWIQSETNPQESAVSTWITQSNGLSPDQLLSSGLYDAYAAYMGYLINAGAGNQYSADAEGLPTYRQQRFVREYTSSSWSVPIAIKTSKISVGLRIESRTGRAQERLILTESGFSPIGLTKAYEKTVVDSSNWSLWSLKLGIAFQATKNLRISAALQPATTTEVDWDYRNRVSPEANDPAVTLTSFELFDKQKFRYQLPVQMQLGVARTFGTKAALTGVWIYHGAVNALISSPLSYYDIGRSMADELRTHQQFRLGGEYRLTEEWTARSGFQWSGSATIFSDHSAQRMLGLGIGYQELEYALDLAYNLVQSSGSINPAGCVGDWILPTLHQRITGTYRARF